MRNPACYAPARRKSRADTGQSRPVRDAGGACDLSSLSVAAQTDENARS